MKNYFIEKGILIDDNQVNLFNQYKDLLKEYNEKFNITAITDDEEIVKKHFVDSAIGAKYVKGKLIDIGSGGGFPAIPIKIINPDIEVTMLEATEKKCMFLNVVIEKLGLTGITVLNGRAEELAKNIKYREAFDTCTARAVARLNTLSEYCLPFVKKGGSFVALKGDAEEEVKESLNAFSILGGKLKDKINYNLFESKRCIVIVDKIKNTPEKYPRGRGKERKSPL
ncbi:MAG: 16S rRNA (guanine(527)-N(7))-methyltransferase RsmG [Clostridia bacterium]|nr:16S rRNA (guanine(527)-N(7))-methyltransferase RsmG [Clostridia bacterium]